MTVKERLHRIIEEMPESEARRAEAMLRGLDLPALQRRHGAQRLTPEERRARVRAFRGSAAHLPGSVEEFLRRKHEDTEREEARLGQRRSEPQP